ncbi:MAG: CsgG/HfaB family protein, partial [Bacillota bacterium]
MEGFRGPEILNGITQLVTDRLVKTESIKVVERTRLNDVLDEQDLGRSGRIDPATAAEIGRILGVDALIVGTLTQLDVGEKGGISYGPFKVTGVSARVVLTGRVVDASTGEIKNSFRSEGKALDASFSISDLKGFSFDSKSFKSSVLGKSIQEAVDGFTDNIVSKPENLLSSIKQIEARVVRIIGGHLVIDMGSIEGVKEKQEGKLIRKINVEEVGSEIDIPIGKIKVLTVQDNGAVITVMESQEA